MYASLLFSSKTNLTNDAQFLREELNNVLPPPCPCPENKLVPVQTVLLLYIGGGVVLLKFCLYFRLWLAIYIFYSCIMYIYRRSRDSVYFRLWSAIYLHFLLYSSFAVFFCSKSYKLLQEKCEYVIVYIGVSWGFRIRLFSRFQIVNPQVLLRRSLMIVDTPPPPHTPGHTHHHTVPMP